MQPFLGRDAGIIRRRRVEAPVGQSEGECEETKGGREEGTEGCLRSNAPGKDNQDAYVTLISMV